MAIGKSSWRDVTEAELAATGKVKTGSVKPLTEQEQAIARARMPQERSKYRNVKTVVDGIRFDSKREAEHWMGLRAREQTGEITDLRRQVRFSLYCPEFDAEENIIPGNCLQVAEYVADFVYRDRGQLVVEDAKARRISPYPLKAKWLFLQQGIEIRET